MAKPPSQDVTQILLNWCNGDSDALDRLMPLVYQELQEGLVDQRRGL